MPQKYKVRIYKVVDEKGNTDFRGTVKEIAEHYYVSTQTVYGTASGRIPKFVQKYDLVPDGYTTIERRKYKNHIF